MVWGLCFAFTGVLAYRAFLAERRMVDDLFIYLRYARNLAERGEIAFSAGARVEGTSSLLWTLILGGAWKLGLRGAGAAKALSFVFMAAIPAVATLSARRLAPDRPLAAVLPAAALALDCDLATWGISGMDTPLLAFGLVAAVALAASERWTAAAVALGLLPWMRPEGALLALVGLAFVLPKDRRAAAIGLAPIALLVLFRLVYFGELLPNTFFAKMGPAAGRDYDGVGYVLSLVARRPLLVVLPLVLAFRTEQARLPLALAAGVFVFALVAGGDWMMNRRFLVPALPLLAVAAAVAAPARWLPLAAAALLVEGALSTRRSLDQTWRRHEKVDERLASLRILERPFSAYPMDWMPTHLMRTIAPYVRSGDAVAHVDVGQLPYVLHDVRFLDGFGLVDREGGRVAFAPADARRREAARAAFFEARPAAVIVVLDDARRPIAPAQMAFWDDPRFRADYIPIAEVPTWGDHPCVTLVRRDRPADEPAVAERRVADWLSRARDVRAAF